MTIKELDELLENVDRELLTFGYQDPDEKSVMVTMTIPLEEGNIIRIKSLWEYKLPEELNALQIAVGMKSGILDVWSEEYELNCRYDPDPNPEYIEPNHTISRHIRWTDWPRMEIAKKIQCDYVIYGDDIINHNFFTQEKTLSGVLEDIRNTADLNTLLKMYAIMPLNKKGHELEIIGGELKIITQDKSYLMKPDFTLSDDAGQQAKDGIDEQDAVVWAAYLTAYRRLSQ